MWDLGLLSVSIARFEFLFDRVDFFTLNFRKYFLSSCVTLSHRKISINLIPFLTEIYPPTNPSMILFFCLPLHLSKYVLK